MVSSEMSCDSNHLLALSYVSEPHNVFVTVCVSIASLLGAALTFCFISSFSSFFLP